MKTDKGLVCAYLLDGAGNGVLTDWNGIKAWTPNQGALWIHLDYSSKYAAQWLFKESGINPLTAKALIAPETRPRTIEDENGLAIFLRGVNLNPGYEPEDMISVRVWMDQHRIITTRKRFVISLQDVQLAIEKKQGPKNPSNFLIMLIDRMMERVSEAIKELDEQVDELEEKMLTSETYELRPLIADIRRQAIMMRRYLAPQRDALIRLQLDKPRWILAEDLTHLRESNEQIIRCIEDLDSAKDRAAVTQEELISKLSDQLDHRMYLLSVIAVIFLPLTFVTGLFGINVAGIPGSKDPWAFAVITSSLILVALVMAILFKLKKWM